MCKNVYEYIYIYIYIYILVAVNSITSKCYVPEVLNVHMNEHKKNLLFLEEFFFLAVKN